MYTCNYFRFINLWRWWLKSRGCSLVADIKSSFSILMITCNNIVYTRETLLQTDPYTITVVSRVSAHGRLNINHNFGLHGRLPGI